MTRSFLRVAILSDIHGNDLALQKVLDDLRTEEVRSIFCLGDVVLGGPQPREVLQELRRLRCPVVLGNTDQHVIGKLRERLKGRMKDIDSWCIGQLSDEDRAFIGSFVPTIDVDLGAHHRLLCYHGSPRSNREEVLPTITERRLSKILSGRSETIFAGGHTHVQMIRRYGNKFIINPGSVGLPFELDGAKSRNPPWAEYAIVEITDEELSISLRRAGYDVSQLEKIALASGLPHADWWIKAWKR